MAMLLTAELRLWWRRCPDPLERLFAGLDCEERTDLYLFDPDQPEVGIKRRGGGGVEIKLLAARLGRNALGPSELWVKSASPALSLAEAPTLEVRKSRRTRLFRTGDRIEDVTGGAAAEVRQGCSIELTMVERQDRPGAWWTLGFEAFGALDSVERSLGRTVGQFSAQLPAECIADSTCASYPQWLGAAGAG